MFILSSRLKSLRVNNKLTQEQLSTILNLSKTSISNYENEKRMVSIDTLISISNLYNVDLNYLVGMEISVDVSNNKTIKISTEELHILKELKKHKKLYYDLINNADRTLNRIDKKFYT